MLIGQFGDDVTLQAEFYLNDEALGSDHVTHLQFSMTNSGDQHYHVSIMLQC